MANIVVYRDPSGISPAEVHNLSGEISLAQWILDNLSENTEGLHCQILLNGREIVNSASMPIEQCCSGAAIKVGAFDNVTIRFRPQGVDPYTLAYIAIAAIAAAAISIALAPKPRIPGAIDEGGASNNQLNSASNSFRPRQAIPDIAGQIVSYPDFIQPSYYEYISGQRVFTEIFCVGVGRYAIPDVKDSDNALSDFPGSSYQVYEPGQSPSRLLNVRVSPPSVEVDLISAVDGTGEVNGVQGSWTVTGFRLGVGSVAISKLNPQPGDILSVDISGYYIDGGEYINVTVSGDYTVSSADETAIYFTTQIYILDFEVTGGTIVNNDFVPIDDFFILDGDQVEEVWFHLIMPQGIRKGDGTIATVSITMDVQEIDALGADIGDPFQSGITFTGKTLSPQRLTAKFTAADGLTPGRYKARAKRITASLGDNAADIVTLEGIYSVTPYTSDFGDVTLIEVIRTSNQRVNRGASNKINALVTRKLRIYDNSTGIYGLTYEPTRRFCDYVFYLLHEKAGVPIAQINTDELFGIHGSLSDAQLGYFDYTFSDGNIALRERIETACNVARVRYWNEGLLWSFVREESKPFKSLMFNRRNLLPTSSSYAQKFRRPADYDSVTVIYVDPDKNAEKRVSKKIDGLGAIVDGVGIRPLEIRLAGCRNDLQALNRCNLEVRRLIYQAIKVGDTALTDAQLARIGMRVDWVDMYDSDLFDGELLSVAGNVYTTSERFEPEIGVEYWVYVTDDSGTPSNSVRAYPRADGNKFGFEATGLTGTYLAGGVIQSGSRYFIASNSDADASTFTVIGRGRPNERGECTIELAEYNELMFEADEITSYVEPGYVEPGYVR